MRSFESKLVWLASCSLRWRIDWLLSPSGQNFTWGRGSWADVILSDNWRLYRSHQPCYDKQCNKLNQDVAMGVFVLRPIVPKCCLNNDFTLEICDDKVIQTNFVIGLIYFLGISASHTWNINFLSLRDPDWYIPGPVLPPSGWCSPIILTWSVKYFR